jgi:HEAT repeat protein
MGDEAQIQELLAALDSDDLQTRLNAIVKLGELKSVEAIPKLIELLNDKSQDSTLRMTILSVLGDIGHISALRAVMNIAREEEPPISVVAQIASEQILNTTVEPEPAESSALI